MIAPANLQLPTSGTEVSIVGLRNSSSQKCRQLRSRTYHVLGITYIVIEGTSQAVVESTPVETDIIAFYLFPTQGCRNQTWSCSNIGLLASLKPGTCDRIISYCRIGLIPVINILVTQRTVRCTELQGIYSILQWLPEVFVSDVPTQRERWEGLPHIVSTELGCTIMTDIELEKILLIIVVVQTAEEARCLPLVASTIHGRNDFLAFVAQAIGQIHLQTRLIQDTITLQTEFGLSQLLCLETTHYMEVVLLSQREVILGISLEVIVVLLIFILMHIGTLVVNDRIAGNIMVVEHLLVPVACSIL